MPAMVLNASGITNVDANSGPRHNVTMLQKPVPLRRRRSKGTIAGFASSSPSSVGTDPSSHELSHSDMPPIPSSSSFGGDTASCSGDGSNQPQHSNDASQTSGGASPPPRPTHSARLALLCAQNAAHMGARTQLNLCPPGRARDDLLKALQMKRRKKKNTPQPIRRTLSIGRSPSLSSVGSRCEDSSMYDRVLIEAGHDEYDRAEGEYLTNPVNHSHDLNSDGEEVKEEASSGDEDPLDSALFDEEEKGSPQKGADHDNKDPAHGEKLYTLGPESSGQQGSSGSKKLAFNMRKVKWFDGVTASDRAAARQYLRKELANLRKKDISLLTKHLKKMQRRERRRVEIERGRRNGLDSRTSENLSDDDDEELLEQTVHTSGLGKLPPNMTPSLSAALVTESLAITPLESLEGMAKCYEGIVAAGSALLDGVGDNEKSRPSKAEIMSALAPLLITTLEKASGEAILALAKLRKLCGTKRYQRRFVQRIAPSLVRPPSAAMWCLRHRDEMESILAATEMILDASYEVFAAGWYERGRTLLDDSKRAETLNAAAMQLKRLSSQHCSDRFTKRLTMVGGSHRRGSTLFGSTPAKNVSSAGTSQKTEVLAEWEVLAVDVQIRRSIENLFTKDWSRVHLTNVPPRDGESYPNQRKSRGITGNRPKASSSEHLQVDTGAMSLPDQNSHHSSPTRLGPSKNMLPISPGVVPLSSGGIISGDGEFDSMFGKSSSVNSPTLIVHDDITSAQESKAYDPLSAPGTPMQSDNMFVGTPPRSPPPSNGFGQSGLLSSPRKQLSLVSPPLNKQPQYVENSGPAPNFPLMPSNLESGRPGLAPAPLSPSNTARKESAHQRFSTSHSVPGSQSTYLRTLTSTAAERKRTVAACRALRAQIARFEDAFFLLHKRAPKGAAERAPLATTYAQYREWKRAIRADAASRIQALFRGARVRWSLMTNPDPRFKEIVMNRAGRPERRYIPEPISNSIYPDRRTKPLTMNTSRANDAHFGVEVFYQEPTNGSLNSRDSSSPSSRKGSRDDDFSYSVSTAPQHHYSSRTLGSMSSSSQPTFNDMTFPELQTRKRELKQQLKQYDMSFFNQHGRMPVKQEKEPIRHLYENYNSLKNRISAHDREGPPTTPVLPVPRPIPPPTINYGETNGNGDNFLPIASTSSSEKNGKWKGSRGSGGKPSSSSIPSLDLAGLKTEKQTLHQMLRSYEKDFFNLHSRQVSCYADIRPVASQYRRYKEIKKQISALQESSGEKK